VIGWLGALRAIVGHATICKIMKTSDWITVLAIVCGPILAVQAQKWIEALREDKNRRLNTFKGLMATRGAPPFTQSRRSTEYD